MEAQAERVIDLTEFQNLGLILKTNSGVFYTNQSAGFACSHPKIEGVFDPLPIRLGNTELLALGLQFRGSWEHISEADAEQIDTILRRNGHEYVSVDRSKLNHSFEA